MNEPRFIPIAELADEPTLQVRIAIDPEVVEYYAECMQTLEEMKKFPAAEVFFDGEKKYLADGHHRRDAAIRAGHDVLWAVVKEGSRADALWTAIQRNAKQGCNLKPKDRKRSILLALQQLPDKSTSQIAEIVGCKQQYVSKIKVQAESDPEFRDSLLGKPDRKVMGRDGKLYPATRKTPADPEEDGKPKLRELDPREIIADPELNMRAKPDAPIIRRAIGEYGDAMLNGASFPPIDVFQFPEDGKYRLTHGFIRFAAHCRNGMTKPILCRVHQGDMQAARWFAAGAHGDEGLRPTESDNWVALRFVWDHFPRTGENDTVVARHAGTDESLARQVREAMERSLPRPLKLNQKHEFTARDDFPFLCELDGKDIWHYFDLTIRSDADLAGERILEGEGEPIIVFYDPFENHLILGDGFRRLRAHLRMGRKIRAHVRVGTRIDAEWFHLGKETRPERRPSNAEKEFFVTQALLNHIGLRSSNRSIARHLDVGESMVRSCRTRLEEAGRIPVIEFRQSIRGDQTYVQHAVR